MMMKEQQPNELLSLTNDYVFRRIFGEKNKDSLADFLSAVLDMPESEFDELIIDDPNLHRKLKDDKSCELDVRVRTKSGKIINVEIQVNPEHSFGERIAYYNARIYSGQLKKGEDYSELHRTVSVVITDFVFIHKNQDYLNRFMWYNIKNGALLTDAQEINTLELPKLPDMYNGTKLWQWLKILKLRDENSMEDVAKGISVNDIADITGLTLEEIERL